MASVRAPTSHFTVLYFASASSFTGKGHDFFTTGLTVGKLFDELEANYPGIKQKVLSSCAVTVNLDYVDVQEEAEKGDDGLVIKEGDEVAILPPVSAG